MILSIISAIGKNNELGKKNTLLWNLPVDMKHFRDLTRSHTVIMGQKTFASIGHPLPNRRNIVLTLDDSFRAEGVEIVHSVEEVMKLLGDEENFVIGGGQIYKLFIEKADKFYITHVNAEFPEADTFFPVIDKAKWQKTKSEKYGKNELNKYDLEFAEYTKRAF